MGLMGLDQILHLPAHAIDALVESLGLAAEIGDDEAAVAALVGGFDASDDAALLAPAPSGIDEFAITANLGVAGVMRRPTHGNVLGDRRDHCPQHLVARQPEDVVDAVVLAPIGGFWGPMWVSPRNKISV